jgi:hypothetical protein
VVASSGSRVFDLRPFAESGRRRERPVLWLIFGYTALGLALVVAGILDLILHGQWSGGAALFLALGAALSVTAFWALSVFMSPRVSALGVEAGGLTVFRDQGPPRKVSWTDPKLRILLWDRSLMTRTRMDPFLVAIPAISLATGIPADAFQGIPSCARSAGAVVQQTPFTAGRDAGAVCHSITSPRLTA